MPFKVATKDMIVYKRVYHLYYKKYLVVLCIPKGTRYYYKHRNGKHRAERAVVLSIHEIPFHSTQIEYVDKLYKPKSVKYDISLPKDIVLRSSFVGDGHIYYKTGRIVKPKYHFSFQDRECASGIHFFKCPIQACLYNY